MCKLKNIRNALNFSISNVVSLKERFVKDSEKNFIRNSKLNFENILRILLQAGGQSLCKELSSYFNFDISMPTPSAFCQQRSKIKFEAFQYLFSDFTKACSDLKTYKKHRILAVDGSEIYIPRNTSDLETYISNGSNKKGWNRIHLNAIYDVINHIYADAVITPGKQVAERNSLLQMVQNLSDKTHSIIVADRGYESYEMLYNLLTMPVPFVLRIKKPEGNRSILSKTNLPDTEEFDIDFTFKVASTDSYSGKYSRPQVLKEGYKLIKDESFPFFSLTNKKYTYPPFRVIKLDIDSTESEYLVTNLQREIFSHEDIKKIYEMRWGIENAFRELKYDFSLMQFHSKKVEHIKQEIYAQLTMYNFCRMITESLEAQVKTGKKYSHKINFSQAASYCRRFFLALIEPPQLKALILRNTIPIRPDRSFERRVIKKQHKSFQYRIA